MSNSHTDDEETWRGIVASPLYIPAVQSLAAAVVLEVGGASAAGHAQPYNTDHYLAIRLIRAQETLITSLAMSDLPPRFEESAYGLLVADGFDGQSGGARASRLVLSTLAHLAIEYGQWNVRVSGPDIAADIVRQGEFLYRQVNDAIRDASRANARLAEMATSLTGVYIAGADLFYAHVGHSAAFIFRNGALIQLTREHSAGRLRQGDHAPWPERLKRDQQHLVRDTIGGQQSGPDVAVEHVHIWNGDRVLLCTNGLTDVLSADAIGDSLSARRTPGDESQHLVDRALAAGGRDDATALVADYSLRQVPVTMQSTHAG